MVVFFGNPCTGLTDIYKHAYCWTEAHKMYNNVPVAIPKTIKKQLKKVVDEWINHCSSFWTKYYPFLVLIEPNLKKYTNHLSFNDIFIHLGVVECVNEKC